MKLEYGIPHVVGLLFVWRQTKKGIVPKLKLGHVADYRVLAF